jgi:hypothetical protein
MVAFQPLRIVVMCRLIPDFKFRIGLCMYCPVSRRGTADAATTQF